MSSSNVDTFSGLGHDDLTGDFGAPHTFDWQVIHADILKATNAWCRAFFDQRGCAFNDVGVVGARFRRVHNHRVRAGEVLQMEPHGVLRRLFDKRVILGLICAYINFIVSVENLRIHACGLNLYVAYHHYNLNKFKSIFIHLDGFGFSCKESAVLTR